MSWEDCGMKPGRVFGPPTCRECEACDGKHHFLMAYNFGEDRGDESGSDVWPKELEGVDTAFVCKHCGTFAEAVCEH